MRRFAYLLQLAWKDAWRQKLSLTILSTCCIIGTAALLATTSLKGSISSSIEENSRTILGADFIVSTRHTPDESILQFLDSLDSALDTKLRKAEEVSFSSMILFEHLQKTRLTQVIGLSENAPLYGNLDVSPAGAGESLSTAGNALLEDSLRVQYNLKVGDVISIGKVPFNIKGFIRQIPGGTEIRSAIAPRIFIPLKDVQRTELIKKGSLVKYNFLFRGLKLLDDKFIRDRLDKAIIELNLSLETHEDRSERLKKNLSVAYYFFDLTTLLSFLLGGLGVASGAYVYCQRKKTFLDTLYYLGLSRRQATLVLSVQIISFGGIGILFGILLGILIQWLLPMFLSNITPVSIPFSISWRLVLIAILNGLFSLMVFSASAYLFAKAEIKAGNTFLRTVFVAILILCSILLGAYVISQSLVTALIYQAACIVIFMGIIGIGHLLRVWARRSSKLFSNYSLQQGVRNLYRPNNQTLSLLLAIGLSTFAILFIVVAEDLSVAKLNLLDNENSANILLFDVQEDQVLELRDLMHRHQLPVLTEVPVVQMRITKINSVAVQQIRNNSLKNESIPKWVLTREYRSSYKKKLDDTERVVEGDYIGTWDPSISSKIPISVEQGIMEKLGLVINDTLTFSVQGLEVETYISSIRKVNWQQLKPNFFILFPDGALNGAPLNFVLLSRYQSLEQNIAFQRSLVTEFGNISAIDLEHILKTLRDVTTQLKSALLCLTLLVVLSALVILVGIIWGSRSMRSEESILLRTLGAKAGTIRRILYAEYAVLSFIGVVSGLIFTLVAALILSHYLLEMPLILPWLKVFGMSLTIVGMVAFLGILGSYGTIKRPANQSFRMLED